MNQQLYWQTSALMQVTKHRKLEEIIKMFHSYCDPCDMLPEDKELWLKWDRRFNPERYDDIPQEERYTSS